MELILLEFGLGLSETIWVIILIAAIWYAHMISKNSNYNLNDFWNPEKKE